MFGSEKIIPKKPTVPTIRQYAKTIGKGVVGKTKFHIDFIWLPGQFNNVTFQTHAFRLPIEDNDLNFDGYKAYFAELEQGTSYPRLSITITQLEPLSYRIDEDSKLKGEWEKVGKNGLKFKAP